MYQEADGLRREGTVRALFGDRSYRLYWYSSAMFGLGIWAFLTALGWTALQLTDSAFGVSVVNVAYFTPVFLFAIPSGVLADTVSRRLLVVGSRAACALLAAGLALLAAANTLSLTWLVTLAFAVGVTIVAEIAARQALVAQLVPPERLVNATALTNFQGGIARVLGPLGAGWLIAALGDSGGYWLFAATNLLFVVWFVQIPEQPLPSADPPSLRRATHDLVAGVRYLRSHATAGTIVMMGVLAGAMGYLYLALMPVMARDVLGGGPATLGWLNAAVGLGSVPGALLLSATSRVRREGRLYVAALLLFGLGVAGFGVSRTLPASMVLLALSGMGFGAHTILAQSILLRIVDPGYHGRVLGTLLLTWGANIGGTLLGGGLAESLGAPVVVALSGVAIVVAVGSLAVSNPRVLGV